LIFRWVWPIKGFFQKKDAMEMKTRWVLIFVFMGALLPALAAAWTWTPLQLSLWEPVQLFPEDFDVYGIRLNLAYGSNKSVAGLDAGLVNVAALGQNGVALGLVNISDHSSGINAGGMNYTTRLAGGQFGLLNTAQDAVSGCQIGGLMNLSDQVRGMQAHCGILGNGAVDVAGTQLVLLAGYNLTDRITGLQMAMFGFNYANASVHGVQFAMLYNYTKHLAGLQLGLVNACDTLAGVQIGLINILRQERMTIMPLLNFRF
jgi:hypothetical protein